MTPEHMDLATALKGADEVANEWCYDGLVPVRVVITVDKVEVFMDPETFRAALEQSEEGAGEDYTLIIADDRLSFFEDGDLNRGGTPVWVVMDQVEN